MDIFKQNHSNKSTLSNFFKNFFLHKEIFKKPVTFFVYYTILLSVLFLIFFSLVLTSLIRMPINIQMPNFFTMFVTEALEIATKENLRVRILSSFHEKIPRGHIISQKPEPGMTIRAGRRITLIASKGPSLENIPSLVGKTILQARFEIYSLYAKYGYTPEIIEQSETSLKTPIGSVLSQEPQAGTSMDLKTPIILMVSKGESLLEIPMENYVGKYYKEVVQKLESLRISVTLKEVPVTEETSIGIILEQSVAPQEILQEGDKIILSVGTGEKLSSVQTKNSIYTTTIPYVLTPLSKATSKNPSIQTNYSHAIAKKSFSQKLIQWTLLEIFLQDSVSKRKIYNNFVLCGEKIYIPYTFHGYSEISVFTNGSLFFE